MPVFGVILVHIFPHLDWIRGEVRSISPYSVRMRKNADQNNCEYGSFSRSGFLISCSKRLFECCWIYLLLNLSVSYARLGYMQYFFQSKDALALTLNVNSSDTRSIFCTIFFCSLLLMSMYVNVSRNAICCLEFLNSNSVEV